MAAGGTIARETGSARQLKARRKAIVLWIGTIPILVIGVEAWFYWRLLMCQTEFFIHHYEICRAANALPMLPQLIFLVVAVLIVFDLAAIADLKGEAPGKKLRFYHGFRALENRRYKAHVAAAGVLHVIGWIFVAGFIYFMFSRHLMIR